MRILSLIPSATETLFSLGLEEELVAVGHASDYPADVAALPRVTAPPPALRDLSRLPSSDDELETGALDFGAIVAAEPDLIFIGSATSEIKLRDGIAAMAAQPTIVRLDPTSIEGLFHAISTIGSMTETEDEAIELIQEMRESIAEIEQKVLVLQDQGEVPKRVVVLQSLDPLMASGRWIPEMVRRSGGWDLLGREGEAATPTTWENILDVDPEMLLFAPVGLELIPCQNQFAKLQRPEFWEDIDAVRRGQVIFVEPVYLNRPGPRLVEGIGMLAEIFDPNAFIDTSPPGGWTPLFER
jgi:iron complex transport system substrate-binding protein